MTAGLDQQGSNVELVAKKLKVRASEVVDMQQRLEGRDFSLDAPLGDGTSTHLESTASDSEPQDEELARAEEETLIAPTWPSPSGLGRPPGATTTGHRGLGRALMDRLLGGIGYWAGLSRSLEALARRSLSTGRSHGESDGARVIHSYDTERRQVLCGLPEQTNSTKHAAGVTCMTCRELLDRAPAAGRPVGAPAGHGE